MLNRTRGHARRGAGPLSSAIGGVAQRFRAAGSYPAGRGRKSHRPHHSQHGSSTSQSVALIRRRLSVRIRPVLPCVSRCGTAAMRRAVNASPKGRHRRCNSFHLDQLLSSADWRNNNAAGSDLAVPGASPGSAATSSSRSSARQSACPTCRRSPVQSRTRRPRENKPFEERDRLESGSAGPSRWGA